MPAPDLPDNNPKTAVGRLKPQLHAIPPSAIVALGLAMEEGEARYGLANWRGRTVSSSVYYDAAQRHLMSWWDGENVTPDGKIHHLAHVMACCAILIDAEMLNKLNDDRPAPGPVAAMLVHLHEQRKRAAEDARIAADVAAVLSVQSEEAFVDRFFDNLGSADADESGLFDPTIPKISAGSGEVGEDPVV